MKKTKKTNAKNIVKTHIPGEVLGSYSCDYGDGNPVSVFTVLVDAKYISGSDGMKGHLTAASNYAPITVNLDGNVSSIPAGSIIIFLSKSTQSRFNYSKKSITILSRYEAAKAYYYSKTGDAVHANLEAEEFAVAYLAKSTMSKMTAWTIFSTLEKYDKKLRRFEKKYFKGLRKALKNVDEPEDAELEIADAFVEAFEELADLTT